MTHKTHSNFKIRPEDSSRKKRGNISKATKVCGHIQVHSSVTQHACNKYQLHTTFLFVSPEGKRTLERHRRRRRVIIKCNATKQRVTELTDKYD